MATYLNIICLMIEFIVLLFTVFSVGWDVLRLKGSLYDSFGCPIAEVFLGSTKSIDCDRLCFSMWGAKRCGPHKRNPAGAKMWGFPAKKVKQMATCAGAFDIISSVVVLVAFVMNILLVCRCMSAWAVVSLYVIAVITIIIAIGCLLGIYYFNAAESLGPTLAMLSPSFANRDTIRLKELFHLYSSAALIVTGWCLQVINLILMIINACCCSVTPSKAEPHSPTRGEL